jgi:hypothetical protein
MTIMLTCRGLPTIANDIYSWMMGKTFGPKISVHSWKVQVAGDRGGTPLVALAEDLEEQLRAGPRQRHECWGR